ncbi:MAG: urease accessory protein UreF [Chroococcales cyanobacterium]
MSDEQSLILLLQLSSPALPVGAYSYSEGLETLVEQGIIDNAEKLSLWIQHSLKYGSIRLDTAAMIRGYSCVQNQDLIGLSRWNEWLSAARETEELRQQSWQMGQSLLRLLVELQPELQPVAAGVTSTCNYAIAFGMGAGYWQLNLKSTVIGYLHSWVSNVINAGVKLIPLGQTAGQQILFEMRSLLAQISQEILTLNDEQLNSCSWGLSLASMAHEIQYTRLFRS